MLIRRWKALRKKGILGINRRNAEFTLRYNSRRQYPKVDDKLLTKQLAADCAIPVPQLYGVIRMAGQVRRIHQMLSNYEDFVIKPARGSGGEGIMVISGRTQGLYRRSDGRLLEPEEIEHHVRNILSGMYSLGARPDKVLLEYRVQFNPVFEPISYQGVPDIRIIVFFGIPVMSMIRLPTQMSSGKANLHLGAVGAGIDIATGTTLDGVWRNRAVIHHPDTGNPIRGLPIPEWPSLLELAGRCYELTGIIYQGVDIVLDQKLGPLLLEINARPGLNIQIANNAGLLPRLR
ncbi:MAG TPA: alpha-L-glutamate ligase-like protein, partial [Oligoflexia bacterium]|nr:alpha-L-glutamate ligase-like protein [Oligoflexia bacterium]